MKTAFDAKNSGSLLSKLAHCWISPQYFDYLFYNSELLRRTENGYEKFEKTEENKENNGHYYDANGNKLFINLNSAENNFANHTESHLHSKIISILYADYPSSIEIAANENTNITLIEYYLAPQHYLQNKSQINHSLNTHIIVNKNCSLQHYVLRQGEAGEDSSTSFLHTTNIIQQEDSRYDSFNLSFQSKDDKSLIINTLNGKGAHFKFSAALLPFHKQKSEIDLSIHHRESNCTSDSKVRTAVFDHGRALFKGRVINHPTAEGSCIHLENKCLLLSNHAEASSMPEFEIYNDNLRSCSHGATSGHLDEEALFYLQSRGIPLELAKKLLIDAFLEPIYNKLTSSAQMLSGFVEKLDFSKLMMRNQVSASSSKEFTHEA